MPMAPSEFSEKKVKLRDHQHDARMTAEHAYKPTLPELNPSISTGISKASARGYQVHPSVFQRVATP